jgi:tetratricopeptide (TPR) repeat protein
MNKEDDCWDLVEQGYFTEAISLADKVYKETGDDFELNNKTLALMNLKRYKEAMANSVLLINLHQGRSEVAYIFVGCSHWLQGRYLDAIEVWKDGMNAPFKDAAGGVDIPALLYYAAVSLSNEILEIEALKLLKKEWKTKQAQYNFPGSIAGYLIGDLDEHTFIHSLSDHDILQQRELCKAIFYIGVSALKKGDKNKFFDCMEQCRASPPIARLEQEYYLAIGELDRRA